MMKISKAVASSVGNGIADDALKDEDNGFWLAYLPDSMRVVWQERFYWIRWIDRLAEQEQVVQPGGQQFSAVYQAWKRLLSRGFLAVADQQWDVLRRIEASWFLEGASRWHQHEIAAWDCYMEAIADYHQPQLTLLTIRDYETMLDRLAGACFQLLPLLEKQHRVIARRFGIIDQFYNNLRDLYEDSQQGVCYFPVSVLAQFGLTQQHILDLSCLTHRGYQPLMQFWVNDYLPQLRQQNLSLLLATDLHPAWQCLTNWFVHRYRRIEQVLHDCQYDFVAFAACYWPAVQQDLQDQMLQLQGYSLSPRALNNRDEVAAFLASSSVNRKPRRDLMSLQQS